LKIRVSDSYDVAIGEFEEGAVLLDPEPTTTFLISDENVWSALGKRFTQFDAKLVLPAGEATKSARRWTECLVWLAQRGADRRSVVLAVGGGVIGDLAGFVAATYMRGIRYVNVATSLVAQIDSAIGGKTAIDLPEGKNLAGAFHQPQAVFCDPMHLATLPEREFTSGMAEAIKYGAILDEPFLLWQEHNFDALRAKDTDALEHLIGKCCELKARVVEEDPYETKGERVKLNFGHSVGHALEQALEYRGMLHGEAIAVGMIIEADIGEKMGITTPGTRERLHRALTRWGLPAKLPSPGLADRMMAAMVRDKKSERGHVAMALTTQVGSCGLVREVDTHLISEALARP